MTTSLRKVGILFLTLLGLGVMWFFISAIGPKEVWESLLAVRWWQAILIFLFPALTYLIAAWRWGVILNAFGVGRDVRFSQLAGATFEGAALSTAVPTFGIGGQIWKGMVLKNMGVKESAAFASVLLEQFTRTLVNTFMIFGGLAFVLLAGFSSVRGLIYFWVFAVLFIAGIFMIDALRKGGKLHKVFMRFLPSGRRLGVAVKELDGVVAEFFAKEHGPFRAGLLISVIGFVWELAQIALVLYFLFLPAGLLEAMVFFIGMSLPRLLPVPGGAGFVESGGAFAGAYLTGSAAAGVTVALLLRLRDISTLAPGLLFWLWRKRALGRQREVL